MNFILLWIAWKNIILLIYFRSIFIILKFFATPIAILIDALIKKILINYNLFKFCIIFEYVSKEKNFLFYLLKFKLTIFDEKKNFELWQKIDDTGLMFSWSFKRKIIFFLFFENFLYFNFLEFYNKNNVFFLK